MRRRWILILLVIVTLTFAGAAYAAPGGAPGPRWFRASDPGSCVSPEAVLHSACSGNVKSTLAGDGMCFPMQGVQAWCASPP
jgi:flagellar basal body-associated protein FliL